MIAVNKAIELAGGHAELKKPEMYFVSKMIWDALALPHAKINEVKFVEALKKTQLNIMCDEEKDDDEKIEEERELCPYCNGTNISPYERDGGSCPHCFGGYAE